MGSYGEDFDTIEEMRLDYLNHKLDFNLRMWPPSFGALLEQAKRASYVAGHLWGSAHISRPELPQLTDWGFKFTANNMCIPAWTSNINSDIYKKIPAHCSINCNIMDFCSKLLISR